MGLPAAIPGTSGDTLLEWARRADAGPFSSVSVIDAVAYPNHDPLVVLAAAAAVTSRVRLMTTVLVLPLRNAVLVAREATSLDALSGGRLTLGLGVGDRPEDYADAGSEFHDRGRRFDRQLEQIDRAWSGRGVDGATVVGPAPLPPGRPEVLLGGYSRAAVARLARWGSGYVGGAAGQDRVTQTYRQAAEVWRSAGRPGRPAFVAAGYFLLGSKQREAADRYLRSYYAFLGPAAERVVRSVARSPEAVRARIAEAEAAGVDELVFWPTSADVGELDRLSNLLGDSVGETAPPRRA